MNAWAVSMPNHGYEKILTAIHVICMQSLHYRMHAYRHGSVLGADDIINWILLVIMVYLYVISGMHAWTYLKFEI